MFAVLKRRKLLKLAGSCALPSLSALSALQLSAPALADSYPSRPIELIIPFPPGGPTDTQLRSLAQAASRQLGQPIVIVNRPGAAGTLGPAAMARNAKPDGYTIAVVVATLYRMPHLMKVDYHPVRDFSYLIMLTGFTNGIVVRADAPWANLQELLADAKARPQEISFGSTGTGSAGHIAMERLLRMAGAQMNFIPYKGGAEETAALLGGHLDVISDPGWGPMVDAGKARVLATLGRQRLKRFAQVPTLRELGFDIVVESPIGLTGPRGMDAAVVKKLHDAFRSAMNDPSYERALEINDQVPLYMGSENYSRYVAEQTEIEKNLIGELGIKLN